MKQAQEKEHLTMLMADDMGSPVRIDNAVERIVSLVPSLTEAVAATKRPALIGATDWCTHPADLKVARVRGPKNPDWRAIVALEPDLVLANKEENRELDVQRLRDAGVQVWVTVIESVPAALTSLQRLFTDALGWPVPDWLIEAGSLWSEPVPRVRARVAVPIWRDPWMVVGSSTYTGDLLRRVGLENVFDSHKDRYARVELDQIDRSDIDRILLPDEPYTFTAQNGPEAFHNVPTELVSGRLLTWYGPTMVEAAHVLNTTHSPLVPPMPPPFARHFPRS
jgi:ABC-type Fe3+-hydroxamate transport system substrate-binding protein